MKLGKLINKCHGNVNVVRYPVFLELEVENAEDFCFYALKLYFLSNKFPKDLENCKIIHNYYKRKGYKKYFILKRNIYGVFTIRMAIN